MFRFDSAIDVPDRSDASIRNNNSIRRVLEEEATEAEAVTEVENSTEDNENEIQPEDVYMDCSLFRACDRCTEIEFSRILECQTGTGRIMTYRCATTATTKNEEMIEIDSINTISANTLMNGDRETRSYQEYRKDDAYYNSNNNNDNLSTIESSTTALIPPSSAITPAFLYHYESCLHTNDEYEFNYIQFQVFICLLGIISIYSIRKQKMFAASLFDQRRMKSATTGTTSASTTTTTTTNTSSTTNVSRTNSNTSGRGIVIQRSNTGLMNSQNNNSDSNNVNSSSIINIEMKSLLSSGSSINDMDIV